MRFVLLEHRRGHEVHWDLMLEQPNGELRTWALPARPPWSGWRTAEELPPHRSLYLTYEGPISGNRGHVKRIDRGVHRTFASGETEVRAALRGLKMPVMVELQRLNEFINLEFGERPRWRCRFQFAAGAKSPPL